MSNFEKMWELLNNYNFDFDSQLIRNLQCVICNGLLVDAFEGSCGCNYCKQCIENYVKTGELLCPSIECKLQEVTIEGNIIKSNSTNKHVSKLVATCPSKSCGYQTELIKMSDHLRVCDKREIGCPFNEIGCPAFEMENEQLCQHLLADLLQHSQMLIDHIRNLKNEISSFNLNKKTLSEKALDSIRKSIQSEILESFDIKANETSKDDEKIEKLKMEVKELKIKNNELANSVKEIKRMYDEKFSTFLETETKLTSLFRNSFQSDSIKTLLELENIKNLTTRSHMPSKQIENPNEPMISLKTIASLKWHISEISYLRTKSGSFYSEYFYSTNKEYQMWLTLYPAGLGDKTHTSVEFRIKQGPNKSILKWPFDGFVTIFIKNKIDPDCQKSIRKQCDFDEPKQHWGSEFFHFNYVELESAKVVFNNCITVECIVDIQE